MSRQAFAEALTYADEASGNLKIANSAEVTVYNAGTETPAKLYEARTGGATIGNPFILGSTGMAYFWADSGDYDILLHDTKGPARFGDFKFGWQSSPVNPSIDVGDLSNAGDLNWTQELGGAWVPELKTNVVTSAEIANDAVGASEILTGAVGPTEIAVDAVDATKIAPEAVGASELATASVGTAELSTAAKNIFPQLVGASGSVEARGVLGPFSVVQPGGQFQGNSGVITINHGMGVTPTSIQFTPIIAANYGVMFNPRVTTISSSQFAFQVYSTQMPSEVVNIQLYWHAIS